MFKRIHEEVQSILARDPAARSGWDVWTCYPGFQAIMVHRLAHRLWRAKWYWLARWISHWARWLTGIEIHPGAKIGRRVFIDHGMGIVIGETAEVGDDCTLYQGVTLGGTALTHGKRHPTLEQSVIVGAGAKILGNFTVGAEAKIGSNAVVVRPVPPGATAIGIPAKIVPAGAARYTESKAAHIKFSAYAVTAGMDDPLADALHQVLDHMVNMDERIANILCHLERLGESVDDARALQDAFNPEAINRTLQQN